MPKQAIDVVIIDKTVINKDYQEHHSIHWTLNHLKYVTPEGDVFNYKKDYLGYFPENNDSYTIRDLKKIDSLQTDKLVKNASLIYIADTYGVYENNFSEGNQEISSAKIYGGMDQQDIEFIKKAYTGEKNIIAEFNSIASPTKRNIRNEFENIVGFKWTGWIARHFDELDTLINNELPDWMIQAYLDQHENQWGKSGPGLVFLHEDGRIEILENGKHTDTAVPNIRSSLLSQQKFGIPETIKYPYWFDILLVSRDFEVISYYDIEPTEEGSQMLRDMGLPRYFPAAVVKKNGKGRFYYFAGDFADNPVLNSSFRFYGVARLWKMFLQAEDYSTRGSFFWNYYFPLMDTILKEIEE